MRDDLRASVVEHDGPTDIADYAVQVKATTSLFDVIRSVERRWSIEERFERAMGQVRFDHDEVRSLIGWYRHIP
ncbi:hypothetical protein WMF27_00440 [Sorangium sp. So ce281]|uniref:hypothetical protein n=1 Tax=unclassified Sorangium TaxID=2621164 RepID=UPI003F63025E